MNSQNSPPRLCRSLQRQCQLSAVERGSAKFCSGLKFHEDFVLTSSKPVKDFLSQNFSPSTTGNYRATKMQILGPLPDSSYFLSVGARTLHVSKHSRGFLFAAKFKTPCSAGSSPPFLPQPSKPSVPLFTGELQ